MKTIVLSVMVLATASAGAVAATNPPPVFRGPSALSLRERLMLTIFPEIHMNEVAPQQVIEWLRVESKKYTPDKTQINFVWRVPADVKVRPVTLNLNKVPLDDVLIYVTQAAGLRYRVERHAVVIHPLEPPPVKKPASDAKPK
jgi:hypothetical protein